MAEAIVISKATFEEIGQFALPALQDVATVGLGVFLGDFATKKIPGVASSTITKGGLELALGVLGLYLAAKSQYKVLGKLSLGVGADGAMKILSEIIP